MTDIPIRRSPSGLAIERHLAALSLPALGLAGGVIVIVQWSEMLVNDGPFPKGMKARFLGLYGAGSFGILKLVVRCSVLCNVVARFLASDHDL